MQQRHTRHAEPARAWKAIVALGLTLALTSLGQTVAFGLEGALVTGIVTDAATGAPLEGAYVVAGYQSADGGSWSGEAYTTDDGTYVIYADVACVAGDYTVDVAASGYLPGSQTVAWDGTAPARADFALGRARMTVSIAGVDRFATAVAASQKAFPGGADCVVITTGLNWPDALGGSALAGALRAPILLTKPNELPAEVAAEIVRLKATRAVVLGGTSPVSATVFSQIDAIAGVQAERIAGANRYETANMVAARTIAELGEEYAGTAFVATGANFPDALGASPLAAARGWPIFLANPALGNNADLVATMKATGVRRAVVLGGSNAVAPSVEALLGDALGDVVRLAGSNRYDTSVKVATYGVENAGLAWDRVAVSTGQNFPDALSGGVLQARSGSVLVLTPTASLHEGVRAALVANADSIFETRFLGSTNAVSHAVRQAVALAVKAPISALKVFIDAGHGGHDPGAVDGTDDDTLYTEEEDINLGIALRMRDALARCGFEVQLSRMDDSYVPLTSRAELANIWGANALVAIHANAATVSSARGSEIYYQTAEDKTLADAIDPFLAAVSPWNDRGVKYRSNLVVLNGATMPAVLIEYGFITNPAEEALLSTSSYQTKVAEATCKGFCAWFAVPYVP